MGEEIPPVRQLETLVSSAHNRDKGVSAFPQG